MSNCFIVVDCLFVVVLEGRIAPRGRCALFFTVWFVTLCKGETMSWITLGNRPGHGEHPVIFKLPVNNIVLIGKFVNGEIFVFDQANNRYLPWSDVGRDIEWRPLTN